MVRKLQICLLLPAIVLIFSLQVSGQDTIIRYKKVLIPNYVNFQYAGNYGAYIIGAGYYVNPKHTIELVAGFGYTSKHKAANRIYNLFLKGIVVPYTWNLNNNWSLSPQTGITISRQFAGAGNTFTRLPKTYPDGYYAPNAFRFHFNIGLKVRKIISEEAFVKAVEFYVETTTNDLYMTYLFKSHEVGLTDIFSMALGLNVIIFNKN